MSRLLEALVQMAEGLIQSAVQAAYFRGVQHGLIVGAAFSVLMAILGYLYCKSKGPPDG